MFTTGYLLVRFALLLTVSIRLQFENMFSQDNKKEGYALDPRTMDLVSIAPT